MRYNAQLQSRVQEVVSAIVAFNDYDRAGLTGGGPDEIVWRDSNEGTESRVWQKRIVNPLTGGESGTCSAAGDGVRRDQRMY